VERIVTTILFKPRLTISKELHPGYELVRLRGIGGFGEVWEAEKPDGQHVALKFLQCSARGDAAMELRSLQIVQGLRHANLIKIDRVWCAGPFMVIAMELADGSLTDLLDVYYEERNAAMPPGHLLPLMHQTAKALDFMNNRLHLINGERVGVQHCDINPSNILVFGETIKLSDFSLTTMMNDPVKSHRRAGTPAYAAPEVFRGTLNKWTDQYALAVCYCRLRGGFPFQDTPDTFEPNYVRPAPDLSMLTAAEQPVVARALSPLPDSRWPTCGHFIKELHTRTKTPREASNPYLERKFISR
jgi:serine/threonine protein kinase